MYSTSVIIDKKSKRSHKIVEIRLLLDPDSHKIMTDPDPGGPKTYWSYTDPAAQHCGSAFYSFANHNLVCSRVVAGAPTAVAELPQL
jgi:hypothetical protein